MNLEIRDYRPEDKEAVLTILERTYDSKVAESHEILWEWLHARDQLPQFANCRPLVTEQDGVVVAFAGSLPVSFKFGKTIVHGAYAMDSVSDPKHRGSAIRMIRNHIARTPFLIGTPVPRSRDLYEKITGKPINVKQVAKSILLLRIDRKIEKFKSLPTIMRKTIANVYLQFLKTWAWGRNSILGSSYLKWNSSEILPNEAGSVLQAFAKGFACTVLRDQNYLEWRYSASPLQYQFLEGRGVDGILHSLAIVRKARIKNRPVLLILEMGCNCEMQERRKEMIALIYQIIKHAIVIGAHDIQMVESASLIQREILRGFGFLVKQENNFVVSNLHDRFVLNKDILDSENWYFATGDGDGELVLFGQGLEELRYGLKNKG